jgi:hypothetical protein
MSVLVVVVVVGGVAVLAVEVVGVVVMGELLVPASRAVLVGVALGRNVYIKGALVVVALMLVMGVALVEVVGMATVIDSGMPAVGVMPVGVVGVAGMVYGGSQDSSSLLCATASVMMWATWSSWRM